ncbi:MAG: hypothetical protein B6D68_04035 [spirochete symbiont of Stewartia floridana]|nr:MAG: hypothetical protein B6D68_04035 [spirochete symbiont of Stewartia floridana]
MSISFRGRLFFIFMAVVLAALLTSGVFLEKELRTRHNAQIDSELLSKAGAVQEMLRMSGPPLTIEAMDSLADRAGEALSARITILLDDNTLLGDSHLVLNHLKKMGNQGSRPEIVQARREGQGQARRYSTIMGISMVYVALPFRNAAGGHGFIRVSMPLPEAKEGMKRVRRIMLYAALLGLAAALFASFIAAA